jgi:hypothetical protein
MRDLLAMTFTYSNMIDLSTMIRLSPVPILVVLLLSHVHGEQQALLNRSQLEKLVQDIGGDDRRIMRWDASEHTLHGQQNGLCSSFSDALRVISAPILKSTPIIQTTQPSTAYDTDPEPDQDFQRGLAAEYATFCVTDNPYFRAQLAQHKDDDVGIYLAIVNLVTSEDSYASSMASHLIFIATFNNADNHAGFFQAGAVDVLASVVKRHGEPESSQYMYVKPVQVMWAALALQNMAASYCATGDGRCYWGWSNQRDHVWMRQSSLPVVSSGVEVRHAIWQDPTLLETLQELVCLGPAHHDEALPGETARAGQDDLSRNLVAFAAAGALKNIALEPSARARIEPALPCLCRLTRSDDWLEANKGQGAIHHLRRSDPCWFFDDDADVTVVCADLVFYDEDNFTCTDYGEDVVSDDDCTTVDRNGVPAADACCGCGGGMRDKKKKKHTVHDEL